MSKQETSEKKELTVQESLGLLESVKSLSVKSLIGSPALYHSIRLRSQLDDIAKSYMETQKTVAEEVRPRGLKEGDKPTKEQEEKWNYDAGRLLAGCLQESAGLEITPIFTKDDLEGLIKENDMDLSKVAIIAQYLLKEE